MGGKRYHDIMHYNEYSPYLLKRLSKSDYLSYYKGWVYACISTIATSIAGTNYQILDKEGGKELVNSEFYNLLSYDFFEAVVVFYKLSGSAYIWKQTIGGKVRGLWILRPDRLTITYGQNNQQITAYKYTIGTRTFSFPADEVIAIHNFNPSSTFPNVQTGLSEVEAIALTIDTDNASQTYNWKFFENNGRPGLVLVTEKQVTNANLSRLQEQWAEKYSNVNNAHKVAILEWGIKASNLQPSQKDMDFIEQRRFSRDEILSVLKVPKILLGLTEGVNKATSQTQEYIYAKYTLSPVATKIADALNKKLLKWQGYFEFINIIPDDVDDARKDWNDGAITLNEFRAVRGRTPVSDGETRKNTDPFGGLAVPVEPTTPTEPKPKEDGDTPKLPAKAHSQLSKAIKEAIPDSSEYWDKKCYEKVKRNATYEEKVAIALNRIYTLQEADMIEQAKKGVKKGLLSPTKYLTLYFSLLRPIYRDIVKTEWDTAYDGLGIDGVFNADDTEVKRFIQRDIQKLGTSVDTVTRVKLEAVFAEGLSTDETVDALKNIFTELKTTRLQAIVRTETTKVSNQSSKLAYVQSKVIKEIKWFTALDERVSDLCQSLHGKTVWVEENFFNQGDTYTYPNGDKESTVKFDYDNVESPPAHTNCRCTLIPVIK